MKNRCFFFVNKTSNQNYLLREKYVYNDVVKHAQRINNGNETQTDR